MSTLYETDFYSWTQEQAAGLRRIARQRLNRLPDLDWLELADEVEQLSRSLERELYSRYVVLLTHLLKWQLQPGLRCGSWQLTITGQRRELARQLAKNPGLRSKVAAEFADAYGPARLRAMSETGFGDGLFPETCPYPLDQVVDAAFWPGGEPEV